MRESVIEKYLVDQVKRVLHGEAYKFKSPNRVNVPDRIVLLPGGHMHFVELKATGQYLTAGQLREHQRLNALGFNVWVMSSKEHVDHFIELRREKL